MNQAKIRVVALSILTFAMTCLAASDSHSEEGMYPISEIGRLNLNQKGLQISPEQIFNADQICLVDGICRVNGCTGSFISPNGLIITNHHCAYRAIQSASSSDRDYLKDGFQAKTQGEEIQAKGYTVRITESFQDVSDQVLAAANADMDATERTKAIEKRTKELEKMAEENHAGKRAEVAEMFQGKTYVLFLYTYIRDVRLVFAPPASVGAFGGDVDNWEWPRHTGDFSFMRAYVAPDGSSAEYAAENVPYKPKKFIQVAPQGVGENDFVFLLGYPGRTARHKTASFLKYEQDVRLPFVVKNYGWQIAQMQAAGKDDRAVALKHSSREKSLANVEKRSRGQLKGLIRAKIVAQRKAEEERLQNFIDADPKRKEKYGSLLSDIANVYAEMADTAQEELTLTTARTGVRMFSVAHTLHEASIERKKDDLDREPAYMDRNWDLSVRRLMLGINDIHVGTDKQMYEYFFGASDGVDIDAMFANSKLSDPEFVKSCLAKSTDELAELNDPFLKLAAEKYDGFLALREKGKERSGRLDRLYGELLTVKQEFMQTNFVPDANGTLRMTIGRVRGYSPEDAVYKSPITTLKGVVDKTTGVEPFVTPQRILDLHAKRDFGQFMFPPVNDVPVAILYDTDTTGGNSGSPILNAQGQLVGVNFDRAFEATINDFAWNQSYSRSIGVDIRYCLWITGKVFGANHLLEEMGVR